MSGIGADLARSRMRPKIGLLEEAFAGLRIGTFDEHHRFLLSRMLARIDAVNDDIAALDAEIESLPGCPASADRPAPGSPASSGPERGTVARPDSGSLRAAVSFAPPSGVSVK